MTGEEYMKETLNQVENDPRIAHPLKVLRMMQNLMMEMAAFSDDKQPWVSMENCPAAAVAGLKKLGFIEIIKFNDGIHYARIPEKYRKSLG